MRDPVKYESLLHARFLHARGLPDDRSVGNATRLRQQNGDTRLETTRDSRRRRVEIAY